MIYLNAVLSQHYLPPALSGAVRAALGKPLRRAAPLTQLALLGALTSLPAEHRQQPSALLWQSTSGPRQETLALLQEVCLGAGEPMPYDFLATQPAIAAAQIQPFLPGLYSATHCPLDSEETANWSLLLNLALNWLDEARYHQILCAHLDSSPDGASGHWLSLSREPLENTLASLQLSTDSASTSLPVTPDFPAHLAHWLRSAESASLLLQSPAAPGLALKFARL
jgi:hypothetical protein